MTRKIISIILLICITSCSEKKESKNDNTLYCIELTKFITENGHQYSDSEIPFKNSSSMKTANIYSCANVWYVLVEYKNGEEYIYCNVNHND